MPDNEAILVIEDQKSIAGVLKQKLESKTEALVLVAHSYKRAEKLINSGLKILVCLTDLNLPDCDEGETIPLLNSKKIATIVLTANDSEKVREKLFTKNISDYVYKDNPVSLDYAVDTTITLTQNPQITVWLVSQPGQNANYIRSLLYSQRYKVFIFEDIKSFKSALLTSIPDIIILNQLFYLTENPVMDVIQDIRKKYTTNSLPIIVSDTPFHSSKSIKLLKYGVNDFFNLDFSPEEFYLKVRLNLIQSCRFKKIEALSQTDHLTGLFNRRYFFENSEKYYKPSTSSLSFIAMIDIDFFKKINDTYGHEKGDEAIKYVSKTLKNFFSHFLISRFGGEEFCIVGSAPTQKEIINLCEQFRLEIKKNSKAETSVSFTLSIGLCIDANSKITEALHQADEALYHSKNNGRNQISVY